MSETELKAALTAWNADATAAAATYGAVGTWDVTAVTDFVKLFEHLANFDEDLSGWDTSRVSSMLQMFNNIGAGNTSKFNRPLTFDTSSVTTMARMLYGANAH